MKVYEILKMISEGKIKPETKFYDKAHDITLEYNKFGSFVGKHGGLNIIRILNDDFEIIEEDNKDDRLDGKNVYTELSNLTWNEEQMLDLIDNFDRINIEIKKIIQEINKLKEE